MEEGKRHSCPVCEGFEFIKENGYFYCVECQTQCEGFCEQVFENEEGDGDGEKLIGTPFVNKPKNISKTKKKGDDFTSWEMLNYVLIGQVEELILGGAPSTLKDTVLQLWAYYLKKLEVAFISKEENVLPRLGSRFLLQDAYLLCGPQRKTPVKRNKVSSVHADLNTTVGSLTDWSSMQIKKTLKIKNKRAFMQKVAETSIADSESILDQSSVFNESDFNDSLSVTSSPSSPDSVSSAKLERSDEAKKWMSKIGKDSTEFLNKKLSSTDPTCLTKSKLLMLQYLALLYEGSKIQISDIIRWTREGHLAHFEAAKHLPESCFVQGRYMHSFLVDQIFPSYNDFLISASNLANYLQMDEWPTPDITELAQKYVKELQLPEMFVDLIVRFVTLLPLSYKMRQGSVIPNYEARVLAVLIILMKLLFGLDGKTELHISKATSQLNKWIKKKKGEAMSTKLFVWRDWVEQLLCRDAVLTQYHFPTKHLMCPESPGNPKSFINFFNTLYDKNTGLQDKYNIFTTELLRVCQPALMNTFKSILEKLKDPAPCENENINFPRSFTPYSLYIQKILEKSATVNKPLVSKDAMKILTQDFSKCDITYLLSPQSVATLDTTCELCVKIKNKSAQKQYINFPYKREKVGKYKRNCYVAVVNCKGINVKEPDQSDNEENFKKTKNFKIKEVRKKLENERRKKMKRILSGKKKLKKKTKKAHDVKFKTPKHLAKSRKRKNCDSPSEKAKRTRISKLFKLYVPCSKYWVHIEVQAMTEREFEMQILRRFPFSFSWLLAECALMTEMSPLTLYKEVLRIEQLCCKTFSRYA